MDGQITIWDYLKSLEPVQNPDDSICEGCKWRGCATRRLEVENLGHTWVYACPGTACANYTHGTPLNLSVLRRRPYCYNRDFLPPMENLLLLLEKQYEIRFKEKVWPDGDIQWNYTYRRTTLSLMESTYMFGDERRFISVDWSDSKGGFGSPCDNLYEVFKAVDKAFLRMEGK